MVDILVRDNVNTDTQKKDNKCDDDVMVINLTAPETEQTKLDSTLLGYVPGKLMKPYVLHYPTGNKVGIVCALDGDVEEKGAHKFKLSKDATTMYRLRQVPKERTSAHYLLYGAQGKKKDEDVASGSSDLTFAQKVRKKTTASLQGLDQVTST